ncbi:hypothetical protein AB751O23_AQ_00010, partial [Chlamydiales bacterium SCGC AB-751-O23]
MEKVGAGEGKDWEITAHTGNLRKGDNLGKDLEKGVLLGIKDDEGKTKAYQIKIITRKTLTNPQNSVEEVAGKVAKLGEDIEKFTAALLRNSAGNAENFEKLMGGTVFNFDEDENGELCLRDADGIVDIEGNFKEGLTTGKEELLGQATAVYEKVLDLGLAQRSNISTMLEKLEKEPKTLSKENFNEQLKALKIVGADSESLADPIGYILKHDDIGVKQKKRVQTLIKDFLLKKPVDFKGNKEALMKAFGLDTLKELDYFAEHLDVEGLGEEEQGNYKELLVIAGVSLTLAFKESAKEGGNKKESEALLKKIGNRLKEKFPDTKVKKMILAKTKPFVAEIDSNIPELDSEDSAASKTRTPTNSLYKGGGEGEELTPTEIFEGVLKGYDPNSGDVIPMTTGYNFLSEMLDDILDDSDDSKKIENLQRYLKVFIENEKEEEFNELFENGNFSKGDKQALLFKALEGLKEGGSEVRDINGAVELMKTIKEENEKEKVAVVEKEVSTEKKSSDFFDSKGVFSPENAIAFLKDFKGEVKDIANDLEKLTAANRLAVVVALISSLPKGELSDLTAKHFSLLSKVLSHGFSDLISSEKENYIKNLSGKAMELANLLAADYAYNSSTHEMILSPICQLCVEMMETELQEGGSSFYENKDILSLLSKKPGEFLKELGTKKEFYKTNLGSKQEEIKFLLNLLKEMKREKEDLEGIDERIEEYKGFLKAELSPLEEYEVAFKTFKSSPQEG